MKKNVFFMVAIFALASVLTGCNLDFSPSDEVDGIAMLNNVEGATKVMDGCYAALKDQVEYIGYASGNDYCRHYLLMSELPADNTCLCARTTDPLYEATAYMMTDNLKNVGTLWMLAYKVIFMSNSVIENLPKGGAENNQLLGEAYFMRALMHLHLVTLYAKPYSFGRDNIGVPLRLTSASDKITRSSVGEVYDQIVKDLETAAGLMGDSRGNHGYPCHDAALGILSRVYLYMEKNQECIEVVNKMLGGDVEGDAKLEKDFANYFANAKTSSETLFCIAHETTDHKGQASVGSMYNGDAGGWGEIYPSTPLMYLYERYPSDIRYTAYIKPQVKSEKLKVYIPNPQTPNREISGCQVVVFDAIPAEDGCYTFKDGGTTYTVYPVTINGEYTELRVDYKGEKGVMCRVHQEMTTGETDKNPKFYMTKFGYQDGMPQLSSPVFCRWAEVLLNRAEAYAKMTGQEDKALRDVNSIRKRAGIPAEGMFATGNPETMHGYTSVLDIVLDERRMELAFEGHRMFDVYRNKRNMDRRYPGAQPWAVMDYNDNRIQYPIPNGEWTVSGIPQNPGY